MSGGFYKYRCKYYYTHNCNMWTWVNKTACTVCIAQGRYDHGIASTTAASANSHRRDGGSRQGKF